MKMSFLYYCLCILTVLATLKCKKPKIQGSISHIFFLLFFATRFRNTTLVIYRKFRIVGLYEMF